MYEGKKAVCVFNMKDSLLMWLMPTELNGELFVMSLFIQFLVHQFKISNDSQHVHIT